MLYTTLAQIRRHDPCEDGWRKLLKHLGKTKPDNARLSLAAIHTSNGLDDALWCLRAVPDVDFFARRFALDCARAVEHLNPDPRVKACNDVTERFLKGKATKEELDAASDAAASDAAWAAARAAAASGAASDAAWAAARAAAASGAASDAAWAAAWAAASGAAWDAASDAAASGAASDAAWAAASDALGKHFLACLKAWPKGKWPKPPKITKG